jgi:murein DD-endopeptidase MepM/ murein hydrolase activator NlpD
LISIVWGGVDYPITQPYGPTHRGIDIGCPMGTPLYAARAGVVTTAAYWGMAIKVDGTNQTDWYLHIAQPGATLHQAVQRGWQIALSGDTQVPGGPMPTGPHLHFEVQTGQLDVYATSLDPVPVLLGQTFGGGGGSLGSVATIDDVYNLLSAVNQQQLQRMEAEAATAATALKADLDAVKAAIAALQPSGGLTAAQDGTLSAMAGDVATVKRLIEKDLAP